MTQAKKKGSGAEVKMMDLYVGERTVVNPFCQPQKLSKCKYELYAEKRVRQTIVTESVNREVIIRDMALFADKNLTYKSRSLRLHFSFRIFLTEDDGKRTILINSRNIDHAKFISHLCQAESNW